MVDTSDEWIVSADRDPRTARRRRPRDDRVDGGGRLPAGHPDGRHRPRRHRPHPAGDAHARLLDAVDRGARQGSDRQQAGGGDGRRRGLLGLRLRVRHRAGVHHERDRPARPGDRRGAADPVPRLHGPQHLHPVRRWRRSGGAVGQRRAGWRARHRAHDGAPGRLHDLAAGRRCQEPAVGRDDRPRRALHPDGGQGDVPLRDQDDGDHGPRVGPQVRARPVRHRPVHPAPGQHPHRRGRGQGPRPADGQDVREPRPVRQHLGGIRADRPGGGGQRGSGQGRRPDRDGRVRCRVHVGRRHGRMDRRPGTRRRRGCGGRSRRRPGAAAGRLGLGRPDPATHWSSCSPGRVRSMCRSTTSSPASPNAPTRRSPDDRPDRQGRARDRWLAWDRQGHRAAARPPGCGRRIQLPGQRGRGQGHGGRDRVDRHEGAWRSRATSRTPSRPRRS